MPPLAGQCSRAAVARSLAYGVYDANYARLSPEFNNCHPNFGLRGNECENGNSRTLRLDASLIPVSTTSDLYLRNVSNDLANDLERGGGFGTPLERLPGRYLCRIDYLPLFRLNSQGCVLRSQMQLRFFDSAIEIFCFMKRDCPMNENESFCNSIYEEQTYLAERELSSFIAAVRTQYGRAQARLSAEDWLDESGLMDSPPRSEARDWRAVTIAASARLATRVKIRTA